MRASHEDDDHATDDHDDAADNHFDAAAAPLPQYHAGEQHGVLQERRLLQAVSGEWRAVAIGGRRGPAELVVPVKVRNFSGLF